MKSVIVEAMFPELKGGSIYKTGRGKASNAKSAISRAFADALKQIRGKHITMIKATITIVQIPDEVEE